MEYATGIEPAIIDLQSNALPFGYAYLAGNIGLEPITYRLTADCSTY